MNTIRKISVGRDYKIDAMHYAVDQEVFGGHKICDILREEGGYNIYISKNDEIILWKHFNDNMGISIEYNLNF
jgi:hypothetical protein